jgi:hypothetical protein
MICRVPQCTPDVEYDYVVPPNCCSVPLYSSGSGEIRVVSSYTEIIAYLCRGDAVAAQSNQGKDVSLQADMRDSDILSLCQWTTRNTRATLTVLQEPEIDYTGFYILIAVLTLIAIFAPAALARTRLAKQCKKKQPQPVEIEIEMMPLHE